ncbi:MAG: ATP-binding protein [Pseudomonadota bacterium]
MSELSKARGAAGPTASAPDRAPAPRARRFHRLAQRLNVRIYLALLASLALAALLFGVVAHMQADPAQLNSSLATFGEIAAEVLPPASAPPAVQQAGLSRWHARVHADLALYGADGSPIAAVGHPLPPLSPALSGSAWMNAHPPVLALHLPDQRWLLVRRAEPHVARMGMVALLALAALAVAIGAYPVVRRLTRRLERLQTSVEAWGAGQLSTRVAVEGQDEVARLATSFNHAAGRIEALVAAQKSLLANASHELRSPLARIRMAVELMQGQAAPALREELSRNIGELDQLIDELLLASRLDSASDALHIEAGVDLTGLVAEECARAGAAFDAGALACDCDPKLIRRMVRNLLENALRYGGSAIEVRLDAQDAHTLRLEVCDRGPGVPEGERAAIFNPFYRVAGASEAAGGVGLGLSLVRQIALRHGGDVQCLAREGGGCCFRVSLARAAPFA